MYVINANQCDDIDLLIWWNDQISEALYFTTTCINDTYFEARTKDIFFRKSVFYQLSDESINSLGMFRRNQIMESNKPQDV